MNGDVVEHDRRPITASLRTWATQAVKSLARVVLTRALVSGNRERGEDVLKSELVRIVPDISRQYTTFTIPPDDVYLHENFRALHAFQVSLALDAIARWRASHPGQSPMLVDIGDSAGTHLTYLKTLLDRQGVQARTLSVNLDPVAVEKIRARGLEAIQCRAEALAKVPGVPRADVFLLYETLEHLLDPISFLHSMAGTECRYMVITVPYVQRSRVALEHLRRGTREPVSAEDTHIFELSPSDWNLVFQFAGWRLVASDTYVQYPRRGVLSLARFVLRTYTFEGFYGVILERDPQRADQYLSWQHA
jgi:hypothetical protein